MNLSIKCLETYKVQINWPKPSLQGDNHVYGTEPIESLEYDACFSNGCFYSMQKASFDSEY